MKLGGRSVLLRIPAPVGELLSVNKLFNKEVMHYAH